MITTWDRINKLVHEYLGVKRRLDEAHCEAIALEYTKSSIEDARRSLKCELWAYLMMIEGQGRMTESGSHRVFMLPRDIMYLSAEMKRYRTIHRLPAFVELSIGEHDQFHRIEPNGALFELLESMG